MTLFGNAVLDLPRAGLMLPNFLLNEGKGLYGAGWVKTGCLNLVGSGYESYGNAVLRSAKWLTCME